MRHEHGVPAFKVLCGVHPTGAVIITVPLTSGFRLELPGSRLFYMKKVP
jgi:hypothetical protein